MKKRIVAGLVVLALIVLISPGLVGYFAERSVDDQLEWAAGENQELVVTASGFERGWFSSAGQHRVEFAGTGAGATLRQQLGFPPGGTPALIIDTHLDHGLLPLSSLNREHGSLMPGLGRAVSHLSIESADGSSARVPGVIYTTIGLGGSVNSHYLLKPGASGTTRWGAADVRVRTDARQQRLKFDGQVEKLAYHSGEEQLATGLVTFSGDLDETRFGFSVGRIAVSIATVALASPTQEVIFEPLEIDARSRLVKDRVAADMALSMAVSGMPGADDVGWSMRATAADIDAQSLGRLIDGLERTRQVKTPSLIYDVVENDLRALVASGFRIEVDQFDLSLPAGTFSATLSVSAPGSDRPALQRRGLLLALEARADVAIPFGLYDYLAVRNPDLQTLALMGFLKRGTTDYEMTAEYKKGLLTINGAPMAIPMPVEQETVR